MATCLFGDFFVGEIIASAYFEVRRKIRVDVRVELVDVQFRIVLRVIFGFLDHLLHVIVDSLSRGEPASTMSKRGTRSTYFEVFVGR